MIEGLLDLIIDYETGDLSPADELRLFSELVQSGMAWNLQGHYGRTAADWIDAGYLAHDGTILLDIEE